MNLYERALIVAIRAHEGQVRKHDSTPYVSHPIMVAKILEQAGFDEATVAAALVHDVLEDTSVTEEALRAELGDAVADIVTAVSEDKSLEWEERKQQYIDAVVRSQEAVWAVSVADKIHNADSFIAHHKEIGPSAWGIFNRGKDKKMWFETALYKALEEVWAHPLLVLYAEKIATLEGLAD
jgi:guanosine-3',5'-bis(diphosphate) 3'-pyrophosphohydrolase